MFPMRLVCHMKTPGKNKYTIEFAEKVISVDFPALPRSIKALIKRAIDERLMIDPLAYGKPLRYALKGSRRIRVSNYRIVYKVEEAERVVFITAVTHRKDSYED